MRANDIGGACEDCVYWSEMIAMANETGMRAYCLRGQGKKDGYVGEHYACGHIVPYRHIFGAVDDPGLQSTGETHPCMTEEFEAVERLGGPQAARDYAARIALGVEP